LWLSTKAAEIGITATSGFAIVATGGLGRREFVPYSDLDLMLLHDNLPDEVVTQVAEQLWYPLWDANIRLDHSVRTVPEALAVAGSDLSAGLAMLEARHICGDVGLSSSLIGGARRQWRAATSPAPRPSRCSASAAAAASAASRSASAFSSAARRSASAFSSASSRSASAFSSASCAASRRAARARAAD
jgi:hypothetical protein